MVGASHGHPTPMLTIVVDTVDETDSHLSMVVGHEDNVKNIFAIGIQLPKPLVHSLQGLGGREQRPGQSPRE